VVPAPAQNTWSVLPAGSPVDAVVARSLGIREVGGQPLSQTLARALHGSDLLLVLDSCEHVAEAVADLAETLSATCPSMTILATSRTAFGSVRKTRFAVGPLPVPDPTRLPRPAALLRVPAVTLFVARWSAGHAGYRLTTHDASAIAEICCRLDGLPLALELAAAAGGGYTPAELLARLATTLQAGHDAPRDVPARHRGLRAVLEWSYRLLDPLAQGVFRRLAVFTGEFDRECAAQVVAGDADDVGQVGRVLDRLVDANLLTATARAGSGSRLRMSKRCAGMPRRSSPTTKSRQPRDVTPGGWSNGPSMVRRTCTTRVTPRGWTSSTSSSATSAPRWPGVDRPPVTPRWACGWPSPSGGTGTCGDS
jgi:non-specific serine/threonine protein kinase